MALVLDGTNGVSGVDGTASNPAIEGTDSNTGIFYPAADTVAIGTGGTEALRVNSSQNVGIGTQSPAYKLDVAGTSRVGNASGNQDLLIGNASSNSGASVNFLGTSATWNWRVGNNLTVGGALEFAKSTATGGSTFSTPAMMLDSSGNLLVGVTSLNRLGSGATQSSFTLANTGTATTDSAEIYLYNAATASGRNLGSLTFGTTGPSGSEKRGGIIGCELTALSSTNISAAMTFFTTNAGAIAERARITSDGNLLVGSSSNPQAARLYAAHAATGANVLSIDATASTGNVYTAYLQFTAQSPNNTTSTFLACVDTTNPKCIIYSTGTVTNRTGTYNSFSDIKLKQDIVDASSQWDDIKALRVVKYRLKDEVAADSNYPSYIGLVAQEAEQISPGLVEDCPDFEINEEGERVLTGTVTKAVKYSILYMKAVKALQEAMTRIEQLEAKVAALENA